MEPTHVEIKTDIGHADDTVSSVAAVTAQIKTLGYDDDSLRGEIEKLILAFCSGLQLEEVHMKGIESASKILATGNLDDSNVISIINILVPLEDPKLNSALIATMMSMIQKYSRAAESKSLGVSYVDVFTFYCHILICNSLDH